MLLLQWLLVVAYPHRSSHSENRRWPLSIGIRADRSAHSVATR